MKEQSDSKSKPGDGPWGGKQSGIKKKENRSGNTAGVFRGVAFRTVMDLGFMASQ